MQPDEPSYDPTEPMWVLPNIARFYLAATHGMDVQLQTLRKWAERGYIDPIAENGCYSIRSIETYLASRSDAARRNSVGARTRRESRRVDC